MRAIQLIGKTRVLEGRCKEAACMLGLLPAWISGFRCSCRPARCPGLVRP